MTTGFGLFSSPSKVKIYFFLLSTSNLSYFNSFKLPHKIRLLGFRSPLSPGQTIATCQHNMSQHFACAWPSCCDVRNMLGVVGSNMTIFKFDPTTPNMSQHVTTWWPNALNMSRPTMLRHVVLACCDRLAGALFHCKIIKSQALKCSAHFYQILLLKPATLVNLLKC